MERRHFLSAGLGSVLRPTLAVAQAQAPSVQLEHVPLPAASAAERMNELGPENAAMAAYAGLWDVTETVWDRTRSARNCRARADWADRDF
jgi:hypothetical protein